jgi:hypothetical protein
MGERVTAATVNARIDQEVLPAIKGLGEELKSEIKKNSLNGLKAPLEAIVAERMISEDRRHKRREATDYVLNDLLHVRSLAPGWQLVKYLTPFALGAFFWKALPAHLVIFHHTIW